MSYFKKEGLWRFDQQFLAGGSLRNWIHLFRTYGGIDARYFARALYISAITLVSTPFRAYEDARFGAQIAATEIRQPPIFILGHWRSGTTYVHQLMAQNPAFAIVNFVKTMIPELFLSGWLFRKILEGSLPETRPMDNVRLSLDFVEEEEYALGNLGAYSFYHALSF
ncbi:MAG: sulfotransferase, partial [Chloroflexi bacterium]|nr:sulfotransferase [Chloroflexota bacterium]